MGHTSRPQRTTGFVLAIVLTALLMAAASAPSPFYPALAQRFTLSPVAITVVFAIYAFTLLATLLVFGSLSDRLGRRPIIAVGSVILAVSLLLFWRADDLAALLVARALQGVAAGLLIPALSAMMVDSAPPRHPGAAALWNTAAPMTGLGLGALGASAMLDLTADPLDVVFGFLVGTFTLAAAIIWAVPETAPPGQPRRVTLRPRLAVPARARTMLLLTSPSIIAGWATNGLFLALGTSLVKAEFNAESHVRQASTIFLLAAFGILASIVLSRYPARTISIYGAGALALGTTLSLLALTAHSFAGYLVAVAIVGSGFGTAFMGALRSLIPLTGEDDRAALLSVVYTISYLAFGLPTIVAGLLVPVLSLRGTMIAIGAVIVLLGAATVVARVLVKESPGVVPRT